MPKRIVIIGAVALGPKVACRARRRDPDAEITLIDKDTLISYGGCGIPYFVSGDIPEVKELYSTIYHAERNVEFFKGTKRINVRVGCEAMFIDRKEKIVRVKDVASGQEEDLPYDELVMATGSRPFLPPIPGFELPGVFALSNLHQAVKIKDKIASGGVEAAVVVGGGPIGIEMAEALAALWGVDTTLFEMVDQLLPAALSPDMAGLVKTHLEENDVTVYTGERVLKINGDPVHGVESVETTKGTIPCSQVIFGVGARPNTKLAQEAGLATGPFGGLLVDARMRTADPSIYAGGDCCEIRNAITGGSMYLPLGSLANRQGRVIGTNITGGNERFDAVVGTFCLKAFDLGVASAGLTPAQAERFGFDPVDALVVGADRAHFFPGNALMSMKLVADRKTRRVLGVQAVGENGDAVKARVDAVAVLLAHKPDLDDISNLEVGYAPPYASAMDIVNIAGNAVKNILDGIGDQHNPLDFVEHIEDGDFRVLDVRASNEAEPFQARYGEKWMNIPQDELAARWQEIPTDKPVLVFCNTGARSYESTVFLKEKGLKDIGNVGGGAATVKQLKKDVVG